MPDLDDLLLTLAAAEQGTFGTVARARHVSQSTVSRAVHRVEASLGAALFVRVGRRVRLADDAKHRLDALRDLAERWQRLTVRGAPASRLALFCTVTASQTIVPEKLAAFRLAHPAVALDLRTGPASAALDAVVAGEVDAAFAPLPTRLPGRLVAVEVATTDFIAVASPHRTGWDDPVVVLPRHGLTRDLAERWCRAALPDGFTVQETDTHEEVIALAALGSGIGIVPRLVVDTSALRDRLHELAPPSARRVPLPTMRIGLCATREAVDNDPLAQLWSLLAAPGVALTSQESRAGVEDCDVRSAAVAAAGGGRAG